jgi:hypothetical protein
MNFTIVNKISPDRIKKNINDNSTPDYNWKGM